MSDTTYLYRLYDDAGQLLYIGISNRPVRRWIEHLTSKPWADQVARMERGHGYPTHADARAAEKLAIRSEYPRHNIEHNNYEEYRRFLPVPLDPDEARAAWVDFLRTCLYLSGPQSTDQLLDDREGHAQDVAGAVWDLIARHEVLIDEDGRIHLTAKGLQHL